MSWEDNQLNNHLSAIDLESAREDAVENLAEQMSCAASSAIYHVCAASNYEFSLKARNNNTNGSDEFNEMFYKIAENLIDSVE